MKILKNGFNLFSAVLVLTVASINLNAQKITNNTSNIKVSGTSTLHKWDMTSTEGSFVGNVDGGKIENVKFTMKATSLKSSDKSLDKNAYKALETGKYPEITFSVASLPVSGTSTVNGKLSIASVTKNINVPVTVNKNANVYTINGSVKLKMTTFGIKPPSVMMGTIKSGDDITINFNVTAK